MILLFCRFICIENLQTRIQQPTPQDVEFVLSVWSSEKLHPFNFFEAEFEHSRSGLQFH